MKVELENGKEGGLCLRLLSESPDERRILVMLDGAELKSLDLSGKMVGYLISKPVKLQKVVLDEPEPVYVNRSMEND